MTLGLKSGWFYRNARLGCINLLLTYGDGCVANCSYCGLARRREGEYDEKSFIRVEWPTCSMTELIQRMEERIEKLGRVCLSMITHKRAVQDTIAITRQLRESLDLPISLLITPTILKEGDLAAFKEAGADHIGIAIDCATPDLFDEHRGKGAAGPHRWDTYWKVFEEAATIFGERRVGSHWITGMGESEKEMVEIMRRTRKIGGFTHLFSFFPECGSRLDQKEQPSMGNYRRIQLARYLIDYDHADDVVFDYTPEGRITGYNIDPKLLDKIIDTGEPFRTSGCPDSQGKVACNRPYANSLPGPDIRNFPFKPEDDDVGKVRKELWS